MDIATPAEFYEVDVDEAVRCHLLQNHQNNQSEFDSKNNKIFGKDVQQSNIDGSVSSRGRIAGAEPNHPKGPMIAISQDFESSSFCEEVLMLMEKYSHAQNSGQRHRKKSQSITDLLSKSLKVLLSCLFPSFSIFSFSFLNPKSSPSIS
jgi:hypothetical protein